MKTKLLTICLLFVTSQVFAKDYHNWIKLSQTGDGNYIYYGDKDSVRKNESGNYIAWILENNKVKKTSYLILNEFDCLQLRKRLIYVEYYKNINAKGKKTGSKDFETLKKMGIAIWVYPKPNTQDNFQVKFVCEKK